MICAMESPETKAAVETPAAAERYEVRRRLLSMILRNEARRRADRRFQPPRRPK